MEKRTSDTRPKAEPSLHASRPHNCASNTCKLPYKLSSLDNDDSHSGTALLTGSPARDGIMRQHALESIEQGALSSHKITASLAILTCDSS